jgi:hypothetical protein
VFHLAAAMHRMWGGVLIYISSTIVGSDGETLRKTRTDFIAEQQRTQPSPANWKASFSFAEFVSAEFLNAFVIITDGSSLQLLSDIVNAFVR